MNGPAKEWIQAHEAQKLQDIKFYELLIDSEDAILPGRDYDSVSYDLTDWDGISLQFRGYVGEPPTEAELLRIWNMGFTVIRIDYADPSLYTGSISGDWWRVKGYKPGHCPCHQGGCECFEG